MVVALRGGGTEFYERVVLARAEPSPSRFALLAECVIWNRRLAGHLGAH